MNICIYYLGTTRHFWDNISKKPIWWPTDIPLQNVTKKNFKRSILIQIIQSYNKYTSGGGATLLQENATLLQEDVRDRSPIDSLRTDPIDIFLSSEDLVS